MTTTPRTRIRYANVLMLHRLQFAFTFRASRALETPRQSSLETAYFTWYGVWHHHRMQNNSDLNSTERLEQSHSEKFMKMFSQTSQFVLFS